MTLTEIETDLLQRIAEADSVAAALDWSELGKWQRGSKQRAVYYRQMRTYQDGGWIQYGSQAWGFDMTAKGRKQLQRAMTKLAAEGLIEREGQPRTRLIRLSAAGRARLAEMNPKPSTESTAHAEC